MAASVCTYIHADVYMHCFISNLSHFMVFSGYWQIRNLHNLLQLVFYCLLPMSVVATCPSYISASNMTEHHILERKPGKTDLVYRLVYIIYI